MSVKLPRFHLKKHSGLTYGLFFVILATENFAYLLPASNEIVGPFKFSDIGFLSAFIWFFCVFLKSGFKFKSYKLPLIPILYFAVWFCSSTINRTLYGQSYLDSFIRSRRILIAILLMYAIIIALEKGYIILDDVISIIMAVAVFEIIVDYLQFGLSDVVQYTFYEISERYDTARLRAPYLLVLIVGYYNFDNFLNGKNKKYSIFIFALCAFLLVGICKHRAPSIILFGTLIISYLLWKKNIAKKIIIGAIILLIGVPIVLNLPIIQDSIRSALSTDGRINTLIIRDKARLYYLEELTKSPVFGFGESYKTNIVGSLNEGKKFGFIRDDNGIWGFFYSHGVVGLIWVGFFLLSYLRKAFHLYTINRRYVYALYMIFEIANLYMGMHWYYDYQYPLFIALALLEYEYIQSKKNISGKTNYKKEREQ